MTDEQIYTIIAEVTALEKEYLQLGHRTQLIRPSEVVEIVRKVMANDKGMAMPPEEIALHAADDWYEEAKLRSDVRADLKSYYLGYLNATVKKQHD